MDSVLVCIITGVVGGELVLALVLGGIANYLSRDFPEAKRGHRRDAK